MPNRPQKKASAKPEKTDLQKRQEAFIKDMEALEDKHQLSVSVKMIYAEQGAIPRFVLVDKKPTENEDGEAESTD